MELTQKKRTIHFFNLHTFKNNLSSILLQTNTFLLFAKGSLHKRLQRLSSFAYSRAAMAHTFAENGLSHFFKSPRPFGQMAYTICKAWIEDLRRGPMVCRETR